MQLPASAHLTAAQKDFFEEQGYLVIPNALSSREIERFTALVDKIDCKARQERELTPDAFVEVRNAIAHEHALLELLDWPAAFPLVAELMGPSLQLNTSHVMIRPPQPSGTAASFKAIDWHRDGCEEVYPVHGTFPWIYTKIGYFLTDLSRPDMGNLRVIPGSHKRAERPAKSSDGADPQGAIQVLTKPGDAVIFQQRLWHAVGPNFSNTVRKNIYMGYCYRWVKPLDYVTQSPELIAKGTPIQKQLLGDCQSEMTFWKPKEEEVPLRAWVKEHALQRDRRPAPSVLAEPALPA
jgi:ectoine hydroxylase-related dioxygenase (phytanoyl-CoA dioxygenase family)